MGWMDATCRVRTEMQRVACFMMHCRDSSRCGTSDGIRCRYIGVRVTGRLQQSSSRVRWWLIDFFRVLLLVLAVVIRGIEI